jgi:alkylation response protein AidB-like acyl-CoA dehydrogenase
MTTLCFASESVVSVVGHLIDSEVEDFSVEAAISKVYVSEALWAVADEALQIAGGNGFMKEFPYERVVRDSRINRIFEGTNEILRLYVGLSGMKDAGDQLKDVGRGVSGIFNDPIKGFGVLSEYASRKMGQLTSIGRQRLTQVASPLEREAHACEQGIATLALAVESSLRRYGKNIIGQQLVTRRLADASIELFVGMCILSRVTALIKEKGVDRCQDELRIARIYTHQAKGNIARYLKELSRNSDEDILALARSMFERGSFPWDVL